MADKRCATCKFWSYDTTDLYPDAGQCQAFSLAKPGVGDGGIEDALIVSKDLDSVVITSEYFYCKSWEQR